MYVFFKKVSLYSVALLAALSCIVATPNQPQQLPYLDNLIKLGQDYTQLAIQTLEDPLKRVPLKQDTGLSDEQLTELVSLLPQCWNVLHTLRADQRLTSYWIIMNTMLENGLQTYMVSPEVIKALENDKDILNFLVTSQDELNTIAASPARSQLPKIAILVRKFSRLITTKLKNKPEHKLFIECLNKTITNLEELSKKSYEVWDILSGKDNPETQALAKKLEALIVTTTNHQNKLAAGSARPA